MTRRATANIEVCACLLAYTAYLAGDGAMANAALKRARQANPNGELADLLAAAFASCVPPHELHRAATRRRPRR